MGNAKSKRKSQLQRSASVKGHYLKYADILRDVQVPLLAKLNDEERERLGQHLEMKEYGKGEIVIKQGDVGHGFFIIVEGDAEVTRHNTDDAKSEEVTIGSLKAGDYFGEAALINNARRNATVRATSTVTCLYLDRQAFQKLFSKDRLNVQFAKRNAVSAEMVTDAGRKFSSVAPSSASKEKSGEQRRMILNAVRDNLLFSGLNDEHRDGIIEEMWRTEVKEGVDVIKQGDRGDNLYVVESGTFDIFVTKGEATRKVAERGRGTCFGELALMYNAPRAATVRAACDCVVWVVDRFTFRRILANVSDKQLTEYEAFLKKVELLAPLSSSERSKIAEALEEVDFAPGATIIKQGDPGDSMYIVRSGKASCTIDGTEVKTYGKGDYFGERALLKNEPRAATIVAVTGMSLLELDRNAFSLLLGPLEDIMHSRLEEYQSSSSKSLDSSGGSAAKKSGGSAAAASKAASGDDDGSNIKREDLKVVGTLGKGSFGHVQLVKHKKTGKTYALKAVSKHQIVQTGQQGHILSEKRVMEQLNHPFLIRLYTTYKDRDRLYFLLEPSLGGELFSVLRSRTFFDEDTARFYAASVVLAFEHMHSKNIIYRDLKPENLLLDAQGYMKVTDFGFAKVVKGRTYTLCGTPDYLAPEIVAGKGHGKGVDWWTLGILIYEMLSSYPPFYDEDPMKTYAKIMHGRITFSQHVSREATHLITKLLNHKPTKRLGVVKGGAAQVKAHAWFAGFDWDALYNRTMKPPIVPKIKNDLDLSNFDDYPEDDVVQPYVDNGTNWDAEF
eukprot:TRINITY_DN66166_c3_g2_i1.p1 TRINITY_DN66166_c3_g2~~TRINITY_DN66166_c3_g2_i1.p1  ORF type:complete len:811 (+),score=504.52 TRINITY_DN66166_c3_g2_i1:84-2435(+)